MTPEPTTQDIRRAQAGDPTAFAQLVELYKDVVYNLALRMTNDRVLAEDLCQEVFLHLYQQIGKFELGRRFKPWLYRVATNVAINRLKAQPPRHRSLDDSDQDADESGMEPAAPAASPLDQVDKKEAATLVQRSVAELPLEYRTVVVLRYLKDLSYEEVAETLGMPLGTVKVRLFRARVMLKEKLESLGVGG